MASIVLTSKSASYGVLASLPTADVTTTCTAINPVYYTAAVSASTISPAVVAGQFIIIKVNLQNAVGAATRTLRLLKSDGSVLLDFPSVSQIAMPTGFTTVFSARAVVTNAADWVNIAVQVSSGTAGDMVVIKANSLVFAFAEFANAIDTKFVKFNVTNLYFISMQPTQEAILGKLGTPTDIAFNTVPINGLVSGFQWSANSGSTLYSWVGSSISIGP